MSLRRRGSCSCHCSARLLTSSFFLVADLLPMAFTGLRPPSMSSVWAADASPTGGGLCRADVSEEQCQSLYRLRERRGGYSRLEVPSRVLLRELGLLGGVGDPDEAARFPSAATVARPLAFDYEFIEVFAGVAPSRSALRRKASGWALRLSYVRVDGSQNVRVLEWLVWMISRGRVGALFLGPAASACHALVRPAWRRVGAQMPLCEQRSARLADVSLVLLRCCQRAGAIGVDELRAAGRLRRRPGWARLAAGRGFELAETSACSLGAPGRQSSYLLHMGLPADALRSPCRGFHSHAPAGPDAGRHSLATLWPPVADFWASAIAAACLRQRRGSPPASASGVGFERPVVNLLAGCLLWRLGRRWRWRQPAHINWLEQRALHALVRERVRRGDSGRCVVLVDSRVALCSGAKGRSPSRALGARWRTTLHWRIGGRIYLGLLFVPTRKKPADAPSRFRPLDPPAGPLPEQWRLGSDRDRACWLRWCATPQAG